MKLPLLLALVSTCARYAGSVEVAAHCPGVAAVVEQRHVSVRPEAGAWETDFCGRLVVEPRGDGLRVPPQPCHAVAGPWSGSRRASSAWGGGEVWGSEAAVESGHAILRDDVGVVAVELLLRQDACAVTYSGVLRQL